MTTEEMSNEFDVLYNNITSNQAPGLDEYEKSVFLTKAERQLVTEYFNNRTDGVGGGFDGSQKRQYDFSSLIKVETPIYISTPTNKMDNRSLVYSFPEDYFLSVNEILSDGTYQYSVMPISYDEYQRLMLKPYSFPVKRGAWRLLVGKEACNKYSDDDGFSFTCPVFDGCSITFMYTPQSGSIVYNENWDTDIYYIDNNGVPKLQFKPEITIAPGVTTINIKVWVAGGFVLTTYADFIKYMKQAFEMLKYKRDHGEVGNDATTVQAGVKLAWLQSLKAPAISIILQQRSFAAHIEYGVPAAEIIGKFKGEPNYQLRYIKIPTPIILEDLTTYGADLTIDGLNNKTECELPIETHQEIVERAVTLAKIAWQGATATQVAAAQQQQRDRDNR